MLAASARAFEAASVPRVAVMASDPLKMGFDQIVFSGGGLRCFWQGGFIEAVRDQVPLSPQRITGVSGGALSASAFVAGRASFLLEAMGEAFQAVEGNVDWNALADKGDTFTPHQRVYGEVVRRVIDNEAEARVADGPDFEIAIARPPSTRFDTATGVVSALAYEAELHTGGGPHFSWAEKVGVRQELIDARQAARDGKLADLICAAAVIPPVFTPPLWDGKPVIDGGMADQAPMPSGDDGETLILLTRNDYGTIPNVAGRTYVTPSNDVPVDKIDFTDHAGLDAAWAAGLRDGRAFVEEHKSP